MLLSANVTLLRLCCVNECDAVATVLVATIDEGVHSVFEE